MAAPQRKRLSRAGLHPVSRPPAPRGRVRRVVSVLQTTKHGHVKAAEASGSWERKRSTRAFQKAERGWLGQAAAGRRACRPVWPEQRAVRPEREWRPRGPRGAVRRPWGSAEGLCPLLPGRWGPLDALSAAWPELTQGARWPWQQGGRTEEQRVRPGRRRLPLCR